MSTDPNAPKVTNAPTDPAFQLWSEEEIALFNSQPSAADHMNRIMREDPSIVIFTAATAGAIGLGMYKSFFSKNRGGANKMMIARIGFQSLALGAVGYSMLKLVLKDNATKKADEAAAAGKA
jgi:hypothetical protein